MLSIRYIRESYTRGVKSDNGVVEANGCNSSNNDTVNCRCSRMRSCHSRGSIGIIGSSNGRNVVMMVVVVVVVMAIAVAVEVAIITAIAIVKGIAAIRVLIGKVVVVVVMVVAAKVVV